MSVYECQEMFAVSLPAGDVRNDCNGERTSAPESESESVLSAEYL